MICLSPGTSEKTARQIYGIDFQPGLTRNQHPHHPPNQNVVPSERHACSLVEGIASIAVTKLCCFGAAWAQSGHSECAAILDCIIGIYGNHMEIMPWFWETNLTWLHHWGSEWHLRVQAKHASMSSSLATHHSVLPGWVNSWKAPRPCQT